ncbi:MAG: M15 family metallopeptidase, partial [Candidatus Delongbacteria bacterium]|nr:M15 family metallopeptidase [Candidatus Delongbacteria bacterium]
APTKQGKGLPVNDNPALEKEADEMGAKAAQGKMADVKKKGSGIQKKDLSEENEETTTIGYETFKSKTFKSSDNAKLYSLTESDDRISINDIYEKEKNYAIKSAIIPKNLKASILETDNSYNAKDNSYIEVVKIRIEDASNTEWNGRVVWTTKTNVSEIYEDEGFCKIVDSEANVRIDAVEVNGKQKTIPDETEITISEYRENNGKYYFKVSDKDTKEEYGWMKVDGFESNLENVSFGVSKAVYISEEENHSTINQNNTKTFEEDGYKYESIDENNDYIRISKGTKVKVISSDESYREVEQIDGAYIGWTSVLNIATKVDDEGFYEVTNDDARIRSKEKNYKVKSSTLSVGTLVIVKERISEAYSAGLYTKVALTEKKGDNYTEKADSDVWVLANSLTGKWADVKGKHATWEKGKYTGQIDLVNVMGTGKEMEYMKADTTNADNDMYGKYMEMADAAKSDGVIIGLVDGFRTYQEQKYLDDREDDPGFNPAATPGYSKHQIGIAIDLNNKDNGGDNDINRWMMKNSYKYGFVRPLKMGQSEGHHWEYRPSDARSPEEVEIDNKKYIHYYFATWSPDKKWDNSDNNKWYATYYEEVK